MPNNVPCRDSPLEFWIGLVSQASRPQLQSNPTLAAGDAQFSRDGATFANLGTLPVVDPSSSKGVKVVLAAGETAARTTMVLFSDASGAEWDDALFSIPLAQDMFFGIADSGSTTTLVDSALTGANDIHIGREIVFLNGGLIGQTRIVTEFVAGTDTLTFAPALTTSVGAGAEYRLQPHAGVDVQSWLGLATALVAPSALISGRVDASIGAIVTAIQDALVDDVWDENLASHFAAGSAGEILDNLEGAAGTAEAGSSSTLIVDTANRTETETDYWQHSLVLMTSGPNVGQIRRIVAFNFTTDTITVAPAFKSAVATGNTYVILSTALADGLRPITEGNEDVDVAADGLVGADLQTWLDVIPNALISGRVDAILGATVTLPAAVAPPLTPTMEQMLSHMYKAYRNKKEQTSTQWRLFDDAGSVVQQKAAVSDAASIATKEEVEAGP